MVKTQRVVITPGEPAGIGPDLVVQLAPVSYTHLTLPTILRV